MPLGLRARLAEPGTRASVWLVGVATALCVAWLAPLAVRFQQAQAASGRAQRRVAMARWQALVDLPFPMPPAWRRLARWNLAWEDYRSAWHHYQRGEYDTARSEALAALRLVPDYAQAMYALAVMALAEGNADTAIALARKVEERWPNWSDAVELEGRALMAKGNWRQAAKTLAKAWRATRGWGAGYSYAQSLTFAGLTDLAGETWRELAKPPKPASAAWHFEVQALVLERRTQAAEALCQRELNGPTGAEALLSLAQLRWLAADLAGAERYFGAAEQRFEGVNRLLAWEGLFQLYRQEGHWEKALEVARKCVGEYPERSQGHFLQARALDALGRKKEAGEVLRRMLRSESPALRASAPQARRELERLDRGQPLIEPVEAWSDMEVPPGLYLTPEMARQWKERVNEALSRQRGSARSTRATAARHQ